MNLIKNNDKTTLDIIYSEMESPSRWSFEKHPMYENNYIIKHRIYDLHFHSQFDGIAFYDTDGSCCWEPSVLTYYIHLRQVRKLVRYFINPAPKDNLLKRR